MHVFWLKTGLFYTEKQKNVLIILYLSKKTLSLYPVDK